MSKAQVLKTWRERMLLERRCRCCGAQNDRHPAYRCSGCHQRRQARYALNRAAQTTRDVERARLCYAKEKHGQQVTCHRCKERPVFLAGKCLPHYLMVTRGYLLSLSFGLADLWDAQEGLCGITREPLTPENATVDHIVPRSRGGGDELENLRWVTRRANHLKNNLLDSELVELCAAAISRLAFDAATWP